MKKIVFAIFLFASSVYAQTAALSGYCNLGASQALTSGLSSSNYQQGLIPSCTVTVYLTGTTTLATIYSDSSSTSLSNPFTANTDASWLFFSSVDQGYDVVLSGGVSPNVYTTSVTLTGLYPTNALSVSCTALGCVSTTITTNQTMLGSLTLPGLIDTGNLTTSISRVIWLSSGSSIQSSIDTLSALGGGTIYLPPGTWSANLTLPDTGVCVNLIGAEGPESTILQSTSTSPVIYKAGSTRPIGCRIENLYLDGAQLSTYVLQLKAGSDWYVNNVYVIGAAPSGLAAVVTGFITGDTATSTFSATRFSVFVDLRATYTYGSFGWTQV